MLEAASEHLREQVNQASINHAKVGPTYNDRGQVVFTRPKIRVPESLAPSAMTRIHRYWYTGSLESNEEGAGINLIHLKPAKEALELASFFRMSYLAEMLIAEVIIPHLKKDAVENDFRNADLCVEILSEAFRRLNDPKKSARPKKAWQIL